MRIGDNAALRSADMVCDYIPLVSTVSNLVDIFQKYVTLPSDYKTIQSNRYFKHIQDKNIFRCIALLLPGIGNIIVVVCDIVARLTRWSNKEFVLSAVAICGNDLANASEALRDDEEVVHVAICNQGDALHHASDRLKKNVPLVAFAIEKFPLYRLSADKAVLKEIDDASPIPIPDNVLWDVKQPNVLEYARSLARTIQVKEKRITAYSTITLRIMADEILVENSERYDLLQGEEDYHRNAQLITPHIEEGKRIAANLKGELAHDQACKIIINTMCNLKLYSDAVDQACQVRNPRTRTISLQLLFVKIKSQFTKEIDKDTVKVDSSISEKLIDKMFQNMLDGTPKTALEKMRAQFRYT